MSKSALQTSKILSNNKLHDLNMARFGRGKKFETTDGFPTIPVQKKFKLWLDL